MQSIGQKFIELTKYKYAGFSPQQQGVPMPPLESPIERYDKNVDLPKAAESGGAIGRIIQNRQSVRRYAREPLSLNELSLLLWCTQGVKQVASGHTFRTVPSAGARHAFETYLLANKVEGVANGLHRYLALEHRLAEVKPDDTLARSMRAACMDQAMIQYSGAVFIWVAVVERMSWRYQQRGYRYLFLDAGHVCQNLYLAAAAVDCGVCAVAAFDDDAMNELLELDGQNQFVIYLATVGKKPGS